MTEFVDYHNTDNGNATGVSLGKWLTTCGSAEELRAFFLNLDSAMKYIHDKGYFIESFDPDDIEILNNSISQVRFDLLDAMPDDFQIRRDIVKENIRLSAFLQIGIYANCLQYLRPEFLKSNFDDFAQFLPEGDIPYYRGVIERNASVYFTDFALEKKQRDLVALENEVNGNEKGKQLVKDNDVNSMFKNYDSMNSRVNDRIYKQLSSMSDGAFISFLVIPGVLLLISVVMIVIVLLAK